MNITSDWAVVIESTSRTMTSRDADRQAIVKDTAEFLKSGGKINVIEGYVAPVRAKTGYHFQSTLRGGKSGGFHNRKNFS